MYITDIVSPDSFRCQCSGGEEFSACLSQLSPLEAGEWDDECCRRLQELCDDRQQVKVLDSDTHPIAVTILTEDGTVEEQLVDEGFAKPLNRSEEDNAVLQQNVESMAQRVVHDIINAAQLAVSRQESTDDRTLPVHLLQAESPDNFVVQMRTPDFLELDQLLQQTGAIAEETETTSPGDKVLVQAEDGNWCRATVLTADKHFKV